MDRTYLPYAITDIYCLMFSLTTLVQLDRSIGSEQEVKEFRNLIFSYFCYLVTDILWALMQSGMLQVMHGVCAFINMASVISITMSCYYWYRYVETRLRFERYGKKYTKIFTNLIVLFLFVFNIISMFTGWVFYIDTEGHYHAGAYYLIQLIGDYILVIIPCLIAINGIFKTKSRILRSEYKIYTLYILIPLFTTLLENTIPKVPVLALNIFFVIHLIFLTIHRKQIYNDSLTGLKNRRCLNQYMEEQEKNISAEHPLAVFMIDINNFKAINDTFGHVEGDNALQFFAKELRKIAEHHGAFLARYGGDEFCFLTPISKGQLIEEPQEIEQRMHEELRKAQEQENCPIAGYQLTASVGYTICQEISKEPSFYINKADEMLYQRKKEWHRMHK